MAASQKQIDANRRNAQKSTGPRTAAGKARSSTNALKHALAAGPWTVLPHEDPAEYHAMRAGLIDSWQPANPQEFQLIDAIAGAWLRMQRAQHFETANFNLNMQTVKRRCGHPEGEDDYDEGAIAASFHDEENEKAYELILRYQSRAESAYYRAIDKLRLLQNDRLRQERLKAQTVARAETAVVQADENKMQMGSFGAAPARFAGGVVLPFRPLASASPQLPKEPHVDTAPAAGARNGTEPGCGTGARRP